MPVGPNAHHRAPWWQGGGNHGGLCLSPRGGVVWCGVRGGGRGSRPLREHEHFAVIDLLFRKDIRTSFRIYLNFRVGKACLDRSDGLYFIGNGDKE